MTRGWFPADRLDAELVAHDASKPDDDRMVAFEYLSRLNRQEELGRQLEADLRQRERDLAEDARRNRPVEVRFDARVEFEFGGSTRRRFRDLTLTRATAYEIAHPDPILKQARAIKEQRERDQAALDEAWKWSHEAGVERFEPPATPTRRRDPMRYVFVGPKVLAGLLVGWGVGLLMGIEFPIATAINTALCFAFIVGHDLRLRHMIARMIAITIITMMIMLPVLALT